MPVLTKAAAAEIAARFGLSLNDAAGLFSLADTIEEGEKLAADFAGGTDAAEGRQAARDIFGVKAPSTSVFGTPDHG